MLPGDPIKAGEGKGKTILVFSLTSRYASGTMMGIFPHFISFNSENNQWWNIKIYNLSLLHTKKEKASDSYTMATRFVPCEDFSSSIILCKMGNDLPVFFFPFSLVSEFSLSWGSKSLGVKCSLLSLYGISLSSLSLSCTHTQSYFPSINLLLITKEKKPFITGFNSRCLDGIK